MRRTASLLATLLLTLGVASAFAADKPKPKPKPKTTTKATSKPATKPALTPRQLEAVARMEKFYADLYARPLQIEDNARLAHLVSVISLARIDAGPTTEKLLFIADRAKADHRVAQVAWEALAVRQTSLTPDQRAKWLDAGLAIAAAGGFPGETAAPFLAALSTRPLSPDDAKTAATYLARVAEENDPSTEYGRRALAAAADALTTWADRDLAATLVRQMGRSNALAKRLDTILRNLPGAPPLREPDAPAPVALWNRWARENGDTPLPRPAATQPATQPFAPLVALIPKPERILDPDDRKWLQESELGELKLSEVNVAFCVDATGSMAESNAYVTAYLEMTVKMLSVLSESIRAGAVYYRHEAVPDLMPACCKQAARDRNNFLVRGMPLTRDIPALVQQMRAQIVDPKAGHEGGAGAYLTALLSAGELLGPAKKNTARVAIVVGDTFVTKGTEQAIVEAAKRAADTGLITAFVVKDTNAAKSVNPASQAASGQNALIYLGDLAQFKKPGNDPGADFADTAFGKAAQRVIASMVSKDYANRVPAVFNTIWRIYLSEHRASLAKAATR